MLINPKSHDISVEPLSVQYYNPLDLMHSSLLTINMTNLSTYSNNFFT
jgi:hypothetical protein